MPVFYLLIFFLTLAISSLLSYLIILVARHFGIVDRPDAERKLHAEVTPLLGGLAVFLSFWVVAFFVSDRLLSGNLSGTLAGSIYRFMFYRCRGSAG